MYLRRPGGQLQFSRYNAVAVRLLRPHQRAANWILQNLTADLCVEKLAEKVAMRNYPGIHPRHGRLRHAM